MLASGELAAGIGIGNVDSEDVKPLIGGARDAAVKFFNDTGVYPINHTVVVKDEHLAANPWLAEELFNAFKSAKASYIAKLDAGEDLSDADQALVRNGVDLGGDPLPYGIDANRTTMEAIIQACLDQKVIPNRVAVEDVFAASTVNLALDREITRRVGQSPHWQQREQLLVINSGGPFSSTGVRAARRPPFALSLSKPVLRAHEGGRPVPTCWTPLVC